MPDRRFIDAILDSTLLDDVYHTCDQWCEYCPVTARCLAFRCRDTPDAPVDVYGTIGRALQASVLYMKEEFEAEAREPPERLGELLQRLQSPLVLPRVDDALERLGRQYAMLALVYLDSIDALAPRPPKRRDGPTPLDVVAYYPRVIAMKIFRAIVNAGEAARTGSARTRWDADVSAKVALLGIERSYDALQLVALDDPDARIEHLRRHLSRLRREVEGRFPGARRIVRSGLDESGPACTP